LINVDAVCFCDIPVEDFAIHIQKYSSFGLSFLKTFLVKQGANPAFYVASDSIIPPDDPAAEYLFRGSPTKPAPLTRGELMDQLIKDHLASSYRIQSLASSQRISSGASPEQAALWNSTVLDSMARIQFVSFCKAFDSTKDDTDRANYYMEREWRVVGEVRFKLGDVYRVVLPSAYAKRFRHDVRDYFGQITFADQFLRA
jgi:hypothetical protein